MFQSFWLELRLCACLDGVFVSRLCLIHKARKSQVMRLCFPIVPDFTDMPGKSQISIPDFPDGGGKRARNLVRWSQVGKLKPSNLNIALMSQMAKVCFSMLGKIMKHTNWGTLTFIHQPPR